MLPVYTVELCENPAPPEPPKTIQQQIKTNIAIVKAARVIRAANRFSSGKSSSSESVKKGDEKSGEKVVGPHFKASCIERITNGYTEAQVLNFFAHFDKD